MPKDSLRIEAYGTIDELNAFVGAACQTIREAVTSCPRLQPMIGILTRVQHELFDLGGELSLPGDIMVTPDLVTRLEDDLDTLNAALSPLKEFILPGGTAAAAGILAGLLVGAVGVVPLTWLVASAMGVVLLAACRPRLVAPPPVAPGA